MTPGTESFISQTAWFFDFYAQLLVDGNQSGAALAAKYEDIKGSNDCIEVGLTLYLLAFYALKSGDSSVVLSSDVSRSCNMLLQRLEDATSQGICEHCKIWELAILSSALRNINLFRKQPEIAELVGGVKSHVYENYIRKNVLMSSPDLKTLGYDVLLACVPMGLFEPEDLVFVEAIKELCKPECLLTAQPEEKLLLAWYFSEQGNYGKARALVGTTTSTGSLEAIVRLRLKSIGQLDDRFITHKPQGNGNRYEPLIEERFPKLITDTDDIVVCAQSSPFDSDDPVEQVLDGEKIAGTKLDNCWEFKVPAMAAGRHSSYQLQFANSPAAPTETYKFQVLESGSLGNVHGFVLTKNGPEIYADGCRINLFINESGHLSIEINPGVDSALVPNCSNNQSRLEFGDFTFEIILKPFSFVLIHLGKTLFSLREGDLTWLEDDEGIVRKIALSLGTTPCGIYGLGERYNTFNQHGNLVDQFVYNQYKDQGLHTYIPMPVFYTDAGWGLHINSYSYSQLDFFSTDNERISFSVEEDVISLQVLVGGINQQITQFIAQTGTPKMVPEWVLGPWMSSNNWDSDAEVRRQVALTIEHNIPATVLVIEAWSDEATFYIFNDATYDETDGSTALDYSDFSFPEWGRWPDPKGLVAHLHDNDLACLLWQIPIIKQVTSLTHLQKSRDEGTFIKNGYGVKNADGTPYRLPEGWFKDSLLLDFTNPEAEKWWFEKRQYLMSDIKVDGFKTDGGECVFGNDLVFSDGSTGLTQRNKYPNDYISAYYQFAQQNDGITFSRSGFSGAQSFPAHWAGDERSTWDAFKRSMLAGLSAGMSGVIFWGWDLAGFSGAIPSAELYIRSAQMACFCPIMQYHAESKAEHNQDRTPWNIAESTGDTRALSIYRYFANLRMSLIPYLAREAQRCISEGTPLMRAMILDYQNDPNLGELWDQYFLGRDLLIAPIIQQGETSRSVYLPEGKWWHLFENTWFESGKHLVQAALETIPVFVRAGAIVPFAFDGDPVLGSQMPSDVQKPDHLTLLVVNIGSGKSMYGVNASCCVEVEWNDPDNVRIQTTGKPSKSISLVFANRPFEALVNGKKVLMNDISFSGTSLSRICLWER